MNPLEYIKEGILNCNWEKVCEGYERLTDESLPLPVDRPGEVRQVKEALSKIVGIASSILDVPISETCDTTAKLTKKNPNSKKKRGKKKTTVNKDGEDSSLLLDDTNRTVVQKRVGNIQLITNDPDPEEIEANKVRAAKTGRKRFQHERKAATTYDVECNECLKPFLSTRKKGEMGQKCPKCLNSLKGIFTQ